MTTKQIAQGLASLGRNGDSVLVHMQPHEVAGLNAIAKSQGTQLTVNPNTGMPEAFNLGEFFTSLLPTAAGALVTMIPGGAPFGLSAMQAGMLAGASVGALTNRKNPLLGAGMGILGGMGGVNMAKSALGTTADQMIKAGVEPSIGAVQSGFGNIPTNIGTNMSTPNAAITGSTGQMGVNMGATNMAKPITGGVDISPSLANINPALTGAPRPDLLTAPTAPSAMQGFASNLSKAGQNIMNDPMKFIGENKLNLAGTLGGAALSGLEPSDLGYTSLNDAMKNADKYDPYATLNLAGDTGLRLYAAGGPVSFADGGDAMKGGGGDAMEGAGMIPVDVADINAKYGYDDKPAGGGLAGLAATNRPGVPVPMVGAFADADTINSARDAYERQLQQSMMNRFGMPMMSRTAYNQQLNAQRTGADQQGNPITRMTLGNIAPTANTAQTANTAATANTLNLNKNYAEGGTIQTGGVRDLYGSPDDQTNGAVLSQDGYGLGRLQKLYGGGAMGMKKGGYLDGPGDGMSDSIPATIQDKQPARLADGEFVVPADVVSHIGNGSSKAGAKQLYAMMDRVRKARTGTKKQGKRINAANHLPA